MGDYQSGKIYYLKMDAYDDDGDEIQRIAISPALHANRHRAICHNFEVYMESGVGAVTGTGNDPQAMLQFSDDGGKTWSSETWAKTNIGAIGEYLTRVQWNRLGMFRQRQFKLTISDPVKVVILGAYAEIENVRH